MTEQTKLTADDWLNLLDSLYPGHAERLIDLVGRELFDKKVERWGPPDTEVVDFEQGRKGMVTPVYAAMVRSEAMKTAQQFHYWNNIDTELGFYALDWFFPELKSQ